MNYEEVLQHGDMIHDETLWERATYLEQSFVLLTARPKAFKR